MKLPEVAPRDGDAQYSAVPVMKTEQEAFFDYESYGGMAELSQEKRSFRWIWILLAIIFGLVLAAYIGFSIYFMSHFSFNTTINGIDVAMQSADEVESHLADDLNSYTLQIDGRNYQSAAISATQIDLHYTDEGQIETILEQQQEWAWPLSFLPNNTADIQQVDVAFDEQKLSDTLSTISLLDETLMAPPVDAHLAFEGNAYFIDPGDEGTTLDKERTAAAIREALTSGTTTLNLEEENLYLRPTRPADDPALIADRDRFNQYVPFQIIYTLGDRREVLDGYTTINWVNTESAEPGALDSAAVEAWVADFASRYDTLGATRTIVNGFGEEKTVSGGTYGWLIDQEAEISAIMNAAALHLGEVREPYLAGWAETLDAQDWGTTYLEVDLTQQYMWYFVDGEVVLETDVITGNPNTGYATPEGVYYIFSKTTNVVTRGDLLPDGSYEWEVPVTYWMPFTYSGCGFHDAGWQPSFGGDYYTWRGSHGCINMPPYLAAELYEMLEPGTPVITHH